MNRRMSNWAKCLTSAVIFLLGACNSDNGGSTMSVGGAGGQQQGGAGGTVGQGGQTTAAGGATGGTVATGGQGGQTTAAGGTAGGTVATGGQGGQTTVTGGTPGGTSGQGGQTMAAGGATGGTVAMGGRGGQTTAAGGTLGGTGGRSAQGGTGGLQPNTGAGGSPGPDGGGGTAKDASAADASEVGHPRRVILVDEGNTRLHLVDLQNYSGKSIWTKQFTSFRDIQLVGGDRLAATTQEGYVELDVNTGETKKEFKGLSSIETLRRLPNGNTVFGGNSDGGITIQELDSQDKPVSGHKMTFTGSNYGPLRLLRRTPQGTFLIGFGSEDNELAEVNWDKKVVWEMPLPNGKHTYQGLRLPQGLGFPDNAYIASAGYAAAIYIFDPVAKKILTTITGPDAVDSGTMHPHFYAGFQILPNGHIVVTNWQNHGSGHGNEGIQLLEYDQSGRLVWQWKQDANLVSSLHGVMVLDGLDTSKLHDDVNGVLAPVTQ